MIPSDPAGGSTPVSQSTPVAQSQPVDDFKVDMAVRNAESLPQSSNLATSLSSPQLNQAERDAVVRELVADGNQGIAAFYGDVDRLPSQDQATIARAISDAYRDGAISAQDLVRISDFNQAGNGAQRLLSILGTDARASEAGGPIEALGQALWQRAEAGGQNAQLDRAGATLAFMSSPELTSRNLNTPEARVAAFESLVQFNHDAPYDHIPAGGLSEEWRANALASEGRLFVANSTELVNHYTTGPAPDAEPLKQFFAQTVYNPDASAIPLDHQRDLVPAVRDAIGNAADTILQGVNSANPETRSDAARQYGALSAAVAGGTLDAMNTYADKLKESEAARQAFTDIVGQVTGQLTGKLPVGGSQVDQVLSKLTEHLAQSLIADPAKPDTRLAQDFYRLGATQIDAAGDRLHDRQLLTDYEAAYAATLGNFQLQNTIGSIGGN